MAETSKTQRSSIEFFKVFLSDISSSQLSFPPAFVVRLNNSAPENATLKDHTGKFWDVKLVKTETSLIIKDGWEEFAKHHSLVDGDFLVFKYDMNSQFFVKAYGRNGLKKQKEISDIIHVKEETESGCEQKYSEMESKQTQIVAGRPIGSRSKVKSEENKPSLPQTLKSKRGRPKKTDAPSYVKPKNPHFVITMTQTSRYHVYVHRKVVKRHNIKLKEKMKLRDENGKLWPVKVYFRDDGRIMISDGWRAFQRKHKVALRDTCVFEFIPAEDDIIKVIQVHIFPRLKKA